MDSVTRVDSGLSHPLARPTMLFGWLVLLIGALISGALPPIARWDFVSWFVIGAVTATFSVMTASRPGPLSRPQVALAAGVSFAAALLILSEANRLLGETSAHALGYLNLGVSLLILRGHPLAGTLSSTALLGIMIRWGILNGMDARQQLDHLAPMLVTVVACWTLFLIGQSIAGHRSRTVAQQLRTVVESEAARNRNAGEHRALSEIPVLAEPLLQRIAEGEELTADFHAQLVEANEAVRDHLRRDLPYHAGFLRAIAEARRRGVMVRVIGNEDPASPRMSDALADRLTTLVGIEDLVGITIRFLPRSRGGTTSLLAEGPDDIRRYEFDPDGNLIREPS